MLESLGILIAIYMADKVFESIKKNRINKKYQSNAPKKSVSLKNETAHYSKTSLSALSLSAASVPFPGLKLLSLGVTSYCCVPIIKQAENSLIKEKKFRNDVLSALLMTGSIATGYYFTAAFAAWLFHFGSKVIANTRNHSEKMLANVFEQPKGKIWILKENIEIEVPLESLDINDIVVVNTGEVIPIDGRITEGMAMIDQHSLTGESVPAEKSIGEQVFASTLMVRGKIFVKVQKAGKDTLTFKLGNILKHTSDFKTRTQSKGEEWADKVAVPLLCAGGLSLPIVGASSALAVINSSPGNMIRVFASIQTLNHLTIAAERGILIKDGRVLETLSKVDTVIFDKTGTLTEEQPKVGEILIYNGYEKESVLRYAATTEKKIMHPYAKAILEKARESELTLYEIEDSEYHIGYGITACIENNIIKTGSLRFMEMEGIVIPDKIKEMMRKPSDKGSSYVIVAINSQLIGAIEIQPKIRSEVKRVISELRQRGIKHILIVSGDHRQPTMQLANHLELDGYFFNILPENKADIVEQLQNEGKFVCFVGDGINDTIAMKKANVSISLSGASSVATDVAQVVLMDGSLSYMPDLFDISKELNNHLQQILVIGLGGGVTIISGAIFLGFGALSSLVLGGIVFTYLSLSVKNFLKEE